MAGLDLLADIVINPPTAFPWEMLLNGGFSFIASVALRIVFLTVCLKLVLSPLDFYQRYKMRKNQVITQRLKPQMESLEKQYGNNQTVLQQKKQALNKKAGLSMLSSCLPMIVTMVVFIWLWSSLNNVAQFNQFNEYIGLYNIYSDVYSVSAGDGDINEYASDYAEGFDIAFRAEYSGSQDSEAAYQAALTVSDAIPSSGAAYDLLYRTTFREWYSDEFNSYIEKGNTVNASFDAAKNAGKMHAVENIKSYCVTIAQKETYNYYYNRGEYAEGNSKSGQGYDMQSFLWIKNVWTADVPWTAPIKASGTEFSAAVGEWATNPEKSGIEKSQLDNIVKMYDTVTAVIHSDPENAVNGWLILPVLALVLNFVSQFISRRQQKKSGQLQQTEGQAGCMMKGMMFVLPAMMFYFALQYCSVFTLYMITNALMSLIISLICSLITGKMIKLDDRELVEADGGFVEKYGRTDPNAKLSETQTKKTDTNKQKYNTNNKNKKR